MSSRSKGNQYEREAVRILENDGWAVIRAVPQYVKTKFGYIVKKYDIWGYFDIVAEKGKERRYIQVTVKELVKRKIKQIENGLKTDKIIMGLQGGPIEIWGRVRTRVRGIRPHFLVFSNIDSFKLTKTYEIPKMLL